MKIVPEENAVKRILVILTALFALLFTVLFFYADGAEDRHSAFYYKPDVGLVQTKISGEPVN